MSDFDTLKTMFQSLSKRDESFSFSVQTEIPKYEELYSPHCTKRILVLPGYRAHCELEFDEHGTLLSVGSFDEL
jgi:hypothetical protein